MQPELRRCQESVGVCTDPVESCISEIQEPCLACYDIEAQSQYEIKRHGPAEPHIVEVPCDKREKRQNCNSGIYDPRRNPKSLAAIHGLFPPPPTLSLPQVSPRFPGVLISKLQ